MGSVEGIKLSSGPIYLTGADLMNLESVPLTFVLVEGAAILQNFVDSSFGAVTVEEKRDVFAILSEVLDKAGIVSGVPNVDGMTRSGGREPPARGEIAALKLIVTYLKFVNHPSRIWVSNSGNR